MPVFLGVIRACGQLAAETRKACYFWLGKTLSVVTDGRFARQGCPTLPAAARRECLRGAASIDGPLVTFS
jgi:hypothetical protein